MKHQATTALDAIDRRAEYITAYRDGLLEDVLPFWLKHGLDTEHGGLFTAIDRDGTVIDTDKSIWFQGRFAWLMATLHTDYEALTGMKPPEAWLEAGHRTIEFLRQHGRGRDGKLCFEVTRDGQPLRQRRYFFSEAFATAAYAAWFRATGQTWAADAAVHWFEQIMKWQETPGLLPAKYESTRPMKSLAAPMILLITAQEIRRSVGHPRCEAWIEQCIDEIERDFLSVTYQAVLETVGEDGAFLDHASGRTINPGHALEAGWFILAEAAHRGGDAHLTELGCRIVDWSWAWGWDVQYGGILYYRDVKQLPVQEYWHDMKFWWPQCEAIIATLAAYLATGQPRYLQWHEQVHDWTHRHFPDPEYGEWYGYLHRDGRLSSPAKGTLYKGPFHIPRMQWRCWQMLERGAMTP